MKKNILKLFCCLLFSVVIGGTVFAGSFKKNVSAPEWVLNPKNVYTPDKYLVYVGSGSDKKTAEIEALNGLSAIFGQSVKSSTNASKRMEEARENGSVAYTDVKSINQDIIREVNVDNLVGVEIKEVWFDSNCTWYAIAVLNREEALGIYKDMMVKNKAVIDNLLNIANVDLYSLQAYCAYDFAQEIAVENKRNYEKVFVIDSDVAPLYEQYVVSPDVLGAKKLNISKNIGVAVVIDGDDENICTNVFLKALSDLGFNGSLDGNVRYSIVGNLDFDEEEISGAELTKIYYDFGAFMLDTNNNSQLFPINISGRQSHKTAGQAKIRAEKELVKKIKEIFTDEFSKYLDNFIVK